MNKVQKIIILSTVSIFTIFIMLITVGTINLSNSGYYQGYWNGGVAGYIKVQ